MCFTISSNLLQATHRIVSLAPSITKIIYNLDSKAELVGCTSYCEIDKNLHTTVVASMIQVNSEKILLLNPDMVLATSITKPSDIEALRKLGLKVLVFDTPRSFDDICNQFSEIGVLLGKKELAQQIVKQCKGKVNKLRETTTVSAKPRIFFQIGAKPLFAVIPRTFMDDYVTFAGGVNIAADLTKGAINREAVLLRNPDAIFIVTMGIVGTEEKTIWESYPNLNATKSKNIFIIDSAKACEATPQNFCDTLELIVKLLYQK
jgi:ABC-type Fe3+-hydroxamate transport system substrate-binding protein